MTNELQILIESSEKKLIILADIMDACKDQEKIVKADDFDADAFDALFIRKDELLQEMDKLDQGFESIFSRIQDDVSANISLYKEDVAQLQQLIKEIIDYGAQISALEMRNKEMLSQTLSKRKQDLSKRKVASRSVMDYYKEANQLKYMDSYFMDQKK